MSIRKRTLLLANSFLLVLSGLFSCSKTVTDNATKGEIQPEPQQERVKPEVRPVIYGVPPVVIEAQDSISLKSKKDTTVKEQPVRREQMRVLYGPPPTPRK